MYLADASKSTIQLKFDFHFDAKYRMCISILEARIYRLEFRGSSSFIWFYWISIVVYSVFHDSAVEQQNQVKLLANRRYQVYR